MTSISNNTANPAPPAQMPIMASNGNEVEDVGEGVGIGVATRKAIKISTGD